MSKKRPATARERYHMARVAELGCLVCYRPAQVHHIRDGVGMSQRSSNFLTVPLCFDHHLGTFSIHKAKREFTAIHGSELDMLAKTISQLTR